MKVIPPKPHLTQRQKLFCREYLLDLNAMQAAIRAGYSKKAAKEIGYENLTKPHIQEKITELKMASIQRVKNEHDLEITADRVLAEVAALAFSNVGDFLTVDPKNHLRLNLPVLKSESTRALKGIQVTEQILTKTSHECTETACTILHFKLIFWDKISALNLLMKYLGLLDSPHGVNISGAGTDTSPMPPESVSRETVQQHAAKALVELLKDNL